MEWDRLTPTALSNRSGAQHLLLAIPFRDGGMRLAIAFPVIGVAGAPLARTIPADLAVHGIGCNLLRRRSWQSGAPHTCWRRWNFER